MKKYVSIIMVCVSTHVAWSMSESYGVAFEDISFYEMSSIYGGSNGCGSVCGRGPDIKCPKNGLPDCSGKSNFDCTSCGKVCYDDQSARTCGEGGTSTSTCTDGVVSVCGMVNYVQIYNTTYDKCYFSGSVLGLPNMYCGSPKGCRNN